MSGNNINMAWQITPTPDLTNQEWRFPEGLEYVGGELNENTVLDYFAASPYFDRHSTNEQLRMQTQFSGKPVDDVAGELRRFTGIEFAVVHTNRTSKPAASTNHDSTNASTSAAATAATAAATSTDPTGTPTLFIIQKRLRESPDVVHPLATYFVVNGSIYQAPDVYSVLSSRLVTIVHRLQNSLDFLSSSKPQFNPRRGYDWKVKAEIAPTEDKENANATTSSEKNKNENNNDNVSDGQPQQQSSATISDNDNTMDVDENTTKDDTTNVISPKTPIKPTTKPKSSTTTSQNSFALAAAFANTLQSYSSASSSK